MAQAVPYLMFEGQATEAMSFYKSVFGGELHTMTFGEAPMVSPPEIESQMMHSDLLLDELRVFACDAPPGMEASSLGNPAICVVDDDDSKLQTWFDAICEGGKVSLPFEEQFWGDTFGQLEDKFGVQWMFNASSADSAAAG